MKDSQYYRLQAWASLIISLLANLMGCYLLAWLAFLGAVLLGILEFISIKKEREEEK